MTKKIILFGIILVFFSVLVSNNSSACFCIVDVLPGDEYCGGSDCAPGASCPSCLSNGGDDDEEPEPRGWGCHPTGSCGAGTCTSNCVYEKGGNYNTQAACENACCFCCICRNSYNPFAPGKVCRCEGCAKGCTGCKVDADCNGGSSCDCGSWTSQGCGSPCNSDQIYSTRTCDPAGCDSESKCEYSSACADPCAGVTCTDEWYTISSYACCDGNSACTTCQDQEYQDHYCSGGSCSPYTVTNTRTVKSGCTDCTGDDWYNVGNTYSCCDLTNPDNICTCQDQEYRNYYCSGTSCTYSVTNTKTVRSNCNNCGYCKTCSAGSCIDKPGVKGIVTNVSGEPIVGAEVNILGLDKSDTTDENGYYFICDFPEDDYDIVVSKQGFNPVNKELDFDGTAIVMNFDFTLYTSGTECQPDCSKTSDEIPVCHADCDGINDCKFFDDITKEACANPPRVTNAIESYNSTHKLLCCDGKPYEPKKATIKLPEDATHVVRITRIVFWRGKFVRMIVDMFK